MLLHIVTNGRKVGLPKGTVCNADGQILGHVFTQPRAASVARYGGGRRVFYTANVTSPGCPVERRAGFSLGTRYPDRASATEAIRAFHTSYPASRIAALLPRVSEWMLSEHYTDEQRAHWAERSRFADAIASFRKEYDRGF